MQELGSLALKLAGYDEQKERYLPRLASGELLAAYALTEAGSGSDSAAMRTTAARDGDDYVLNGSKRFITNAGVAGLYTVFAKTDPEAGHPGISAFVVESDTPGFEVTRLEPKLGITRLDDGRARLRRLPRPRREPPRRGGRRLQDRDAHPRPLAPGIAAQGLGIAQGATDYALEYAKSRETMGKPIAEHQLIAAQARRHGDGLRGSPRTALPRSAGWSTTGVDGADLTKASAQAKLFCSDTAMWVTTEAVQILGGYGYIKEYPVERMMRDAKITQIYEGTNEIQRLVIAREMVRENRAFLLAGVG